MYSKRYLVILLIATLAFLCSCAHKEPATVIGKIFNYVNMGPIYDAKIHLTPNGSNEKNVESYETFSDADGYFEFNNVEAAIYTISAEKGGCYNVGSETTKTIEIIEGEVTKVVIYLKDLNIDSLNIQ